MEDTAFSGGTRLSVGGLFPSNRWTLSIFWIRYQSRRYSQAMEARAIRDCCFAVRGMCESIERFVADELVHNRGSSDAPSPVCRKPCHRQDNAQHPCS